MPQYSKYLRQTLITIAIPLLLLAAFNLVLDPYAEFGLFAGTTLSHHAASLGGRVGKGQALHQNDWDILLLGNSRVQMGLDPQHPAFKNLRVYNAGLYGADFPEIDRAARMAMQHPGLKRIILCLDLFSFDPNCQPVPDAKESLLNPNIDPINYRLANLLSASVTDQSLATLRNIRANRDGDHWPLGMFTVPSNLSRNGRVDWVLGGFYQLTIPKSLRRAPSFQLSDEDFNALGTLLDDASRQHVHIDVVQLPMHVMSLERYYTEQRWPIYEQWLRRLTQTVDAHNQRMPASPIRFWDFCQYSPINTEPYPGPADTVTNMKWYWDPFHFKKDLGDIVIEQLMNTPTPPGIDITDLRESITPQTIEPHLQKLRTDHEAYFSTHEDVRAIQAAVRNFRATETDDD